MAEQLLVAAQATPRCWPQGGLTDIFALHLAIVLYAGRSMLHFWRKFFTSKPSDRRRALLLPPSPAYHASRLKPDQVAAMIRFGCGDFYADISAYGRKHFLCEVYLDGGASPLIVEQAGDLAQAQQLARQHLETARNTELLWAAQGRKGPAVARSEELMREAFETLSLFAEEIEL